MQQKLHTNRRGSYEQTTFQGVQEPRTSHENSNFVQCNKGIDFDAVHVKNQK